MQNKKVFTPEYFGAVADGVTDDGTAINAAIEEAIKCCGTVQFSKDKVYFVKDPISDSRSIRGAFDIRNAKGITIKGENTTIRIGKILEYFYILSCSDITIDGFNFEMYPHAAFRGRLVSVCHEKVAAVIKTDYEILTDDDSYNYCDFENGASRYAFAIPDDSFRKHMFLRRIEKKGNKNEYTVWFDTSYDTRSALRRVEQMHCDIIMPTPKVGHQGEGFLINASSNVRIENCNIKECSQFVGNIRGNTGEIYFENVKMCAEEDQIIPMVAWRDGYHCKDNRCAIHWKNCEIGRLYDDAFNISCTGLLVVGQPEPDVLSIKNFECNGCYYPVKAGDVLSVNDVCRGIPYAERIKVKEVIKQHGAELLVRLESAIPELDLKHTRATFDDFCAPYSTIENCRVMGTVRIRCPATIKNTRFEKLLNLWVENQSYEGPIPHDILFQDCSFSSVYPVAERYLNNPVSFRTTMLWPGVAQYKLKNIRLVNCEYDPDYIYVEEGNDVKFLDSLK